MPLTSLGWFGSIIFFGIPSAIITVFLFVIMPAVAATGASQVVTLEVGFVAPLVLMLIAAFVAYRLEGRGWSWAELRDRFRLTRPDRTTWLWTVGLVAWLIVFMDGLPLSGAIAQAFATVHFYNPPDGYTAILNGVTDGRTHVFGHPFTWGLLFSYLAIMFGVNILGEEIWWRGYVLPRQELVFGARTWILHGILWAMFHAFYHTNLGSLVAQLPTTLGISYVAQRTRNTWPGIIGHFVSNLTFPAQSSRQPHLLLSHLRKDLRRPSMIRCVILSRLLA